MRSGVHGLAIEVIGAQLDGALRIAVDGRGGRRSIGGDDGVEIPVHGIDDLGADFHCEFSFGFERADPSSLIPV